MLGTTSLEGPAAAKVLKEAAPLAIGNWAIFLERASETELRYGLFTGSTDPSAISLSEIALELQDSSFPVILIRQLGPNRVEIRSNASRSRYFQFHGNIQPTRYEEVDLSALAICISRGAPDDISVILPGVIKRIISDALQNAHGTLIAVTPADMGIPASLHDIVRIEPCLDLAKRLQHHHQDGASASSLSSLQAAANLIHGMISSDGITVFQHGGKLLGYRAFIQSPQPPRGTTRPRPSRPAKRMRPSENEPPTLALSA